MELVRKALLAGVGAQEKVRDLVDELVKRGEMNQGDGAKLVKEVLDRAEKRGEELDQKISGAVQKTVEKLGLPTRKDLESLEKRVEDLSARIQRLEGGK
jgi:polyhydroxyalkanoate synthesis regulator phasin